MIESGGVLDLPFLINSFLFNLEVLVFQLFHQFLFGLVVQNYMLGAWLLLVIHHFDDLLLPLCRSKRLRLAVILAQLVCIGRVRVLL